MSIPPQMRATRDLLRRRTHLMRKRAELLAHVQNTNSQYNLPEIGKNIAYKANREGVAERFADPAVQKRLAVDLALLGSYDELLRDLADPYDRGHAGPGAGYLPSGAPSPALGTSCVWSCATRAMTCSGARACRCSNGSRRSRARSTGSTRVTVELHEVGSLDAIIDVVGVCAALESLDVDEVRCSPIAVGTGSIRSAHGILPNPAPATLRPARDASARRASGLATTLEVTTPTGAALMTTLAPGSVRHRR